MIKDERFVHMIDWKLPAVCDLLHHGTMARQDVLFRLQRVIKDPEIRSAVTIRDLRAETYDAVRQLDAKYRKQLAAMGGQAPSWSQVPVFDILQSGRFVAP